MPVDRGGALVPGCESAVPAAAELVQELAQIDDADLDLARRRGMHVAAEQELEHRDVPADGAVSQRAPAEEGAAERAERPACPRAGASVGAEAGASLERLGRVHGLRTGDRVDRPAVEPVGAEGDLQPG